MSMGRHQLNIQHLALIALYVKRMEQLSPCGAPAGFATGCIMLRPPIVLFSVAGLAIRFQNTSVKPLIEQSVIFGLIVFGVNLGFADFGRGADAAEISQVPAVTAVRNQVAALKFEETFAAEASPSEFPDKYHRWKTNYYFGNQNDLTSRGYPSTISVMLDGKFASGPGILGPETKSGNLRIPAYKMREPDFAKYGLGGSHPYAAGVVTTEKSFSQTFGYFEIGAKLPDCSGTRPAFWLLPTARTKENGGRLAEIDIFEHYGGPITVMSGGIKPVVIDRVGKPFATLHYGTVSDEKRLSNGQKLPARINLSEFHTFGFLWTPATMTFFIDQTATLTIANPGVIDPHYIVLSVDVLKAAGDPANCNFPASMDVDYVRVWALR